MRGLRIPHITLVALLCLALTLVTSASASAQEPQAVDGAADFRTAPLVGEGTFRDEIVTGETVYYSVLYRNYEDLHIAARIVGVDVDTGEELELIRRFVGPNLSELRAQDEDIGPGYTAWYGDVETNIWFVAFSLDTTSQLGLVHELEFELTGVESAGSQEECGDGCTLDDDLEALEAEMAGLEEEVDECGEECSAAPTRDDLVAQRDEAQEGIDGERAAIVDLCGGEECESLPASSTTPWAFVVLLGVTTLVAGGGLARTVLRRSAGTA